jgi:hypothetical protein
MTCRGFVGFEGLSFLPTHPTQAMTGLVACTGGRVSSARSGTKIR